MYNELCHCLSIKLPLVRGIAIKLLFKKNNCHIECYCLKRSSNIHTRIFTRIWMFLHNCMVSYVTTEWALKWIKNWKAKCKLFFHFLLFFCFTQKVNCVCKIPHNGTTLDYSVTDNNCFYIQCMCEHLME